MKKYVASSASGGEFVVPLLVGDSWQLVGEKSLATYAIGLVVYVGRDVTENDVLAKAVHTGARIESVEALTEKVRAVLAAVQATKVGGRISLTSEGHVNAA